MFILLDLARSQVARVSPALDHVWTQKDDLLHCLESVWLRPDSNRKRWQHCYHMERVRAESCRATCKHRLSPAPHRLGAARPKQCCVHWRALPSKSVELCWCIGSRYQPQRNTRIYIRCLSDEMPSSSAGKSCYWAHWRKLIILW